MRKILVVDNDPVLLKQMLRLLEKEGHQVRLAEGGLQALDVVKSFTPDIIFVDLVMPVIDGRTLCRIIRGIDSLKAAKMVILSAIAAEEQTDLSHLNVYACIAKGPFPAMSRHITDTIRQIELGAAKDTAQGVIGRDEVHPRGITKELLVAYRHFEIILEKMSEGVAGINPDGRIVYANPAFFSMTGLAEQELFGSFFVDLFSADDQERVKTLLNNCNGKSLAPVEDVPVLMNQRLVTLEFLPFREYGFTSVILNDITERKLAEEKQRKDHEKFSILVEKYPLGVALISKNGRYEYINPSFIRTFGYTLNDIPTGAEWFVKAFPGIADREEAVFAWIHDIKKSDAFDVENRIFSVRCKDGTDKLIQFRLTRLEKNNHLVISEDITERKRLERQLEQAQKMEAIGTLAGGIAHDFNNLMMAILGNTTLMLLRTDPAHPNYNRLRTIENQIKSGAKLTEQLLGYARKGKYHAKPMDLNLFLQNALETLGRTRKEVRLHFDLAEDLSSIEADEGQIEQVLLNLYVNAADAMSGGGDIFLKTKNVAHYEITGTPFKPLPGRYVLVQFIDTGIGMDEETQKRIFDPFFTTKEMGRGTGLGLASVYGIIKGHYGYINVASERGKGTIFSIYLPVSDKKIEKKTQTYTTIETGNETILLVDDERIVLEVNTEILKSFGYVVLTAQGGEEAVRVFEENKDEIDLVVLDMILPDISGGVVYDKIKEIQPEIKVLLSSGYSIDSEAKGILERGCDDFIQKPYDLKAFSSKIRNLLDKSCQASGNEKP